MARSLIGAKYSAHVECVEEAQLPRSVQSARSKLAPASSVSLWPAEHPSTEPLPVVVEYVTGGYLSRSLLNSILVWSPAVHDLADAAIFDDPEEASDWLDQREIQEPVALRYLAAAQSDHDQREAALSP